MALINARCANYVDRLPLKPYYEGPRLSSQILNIIHDIGFYEFLILIRRVSVLMDTATDGVSYQAVQRRPFAMIAR